MTVKLLRHEGQTQEISLIEGQNARHWSGLSEIYIQLSQANATTKKVVIKTGKDGMQCILVHCIPVALPGLKIRCKGKT